VLLGILTGDMCRVYLSLTGTHSFITMGTMVTHVAMYEIATNQIRCRDCGGTSTFFEGWESHGTVYIAVDCSECENTYYGEVPSDE
jgi:ribosomal protein S27E